VRANLLFVMLSLAGLGCQPAFVPQLLSVTELTPREA